MDRLELNEPVRLRFDVRHIADAIDRCRQLMPFFGHQPRIVDGVELDFDIWHRVKRPLGYSEVLVEELCRQVLTLQQFRLANGVADETEAMPRESRPMRSVPRRNGLRKPRSFQRPGRKHDKRRVDIAEPLGEGSCEAQVVVRGNAG
ncbi:MAG: hypothetical protein P4M09_01710 [Devosia sp.]|nr:hypothetical protein [Devosia sp.]